MIALCSECVMCGAALTTRIIVWARSESVRPCVRAYLYVSRQSIVHVCAFPRGRVRVTAAAGGAATDGAGTARECMRRQTEAGGSRRHTLSFARAGKTLLPMGSQVHTARVQGLRVATITYICSTKDLGRSIRRSPSATSNEAHTTRLVRSSPVRTVCHTEAARAL